MKVIRFALLLLFLLWTDLAAIAANTYVTKQEVPVLKQANGEQLNHWPTDTIFTGSAFDEFWIEVSGIVLEDGWQPVQPHLFIANTSDIMIKPKLKQNGGDTVMFKTFSNGHNKAKTYKVLADTRAYLSHPNSAPKTEFETWINSKEFTSAYEDAQYIKATGNISDDGWQAFDKPRWIKKPASLQDITLPKPYHREEDTLRVAVVDKEKLQLTLYEIVSGELHKLMRAPVALGYDRCLSKEKGGQCYYTPEGEFDIDFKMFDPDGIQWCVPPKMRGEFKEKLARGERCWRGIMGRHALNFGNSLFLHGTSNPASIGNRSTHGCVRLRNTDIDTIYRLMKKGDKVVITAQPQELDLLALVQSDLAVTD